ncbi:MAG: dependent oxidoreductase [Frankiales bacterium]|nr:dependent oxidoreductase [Frankiales bacterium]
MIGVSGATAITVALADAEPRAFWLDRLDRPPARAPLTGPNEAAQLTVVGAGFGGLWTALLAKERDPDRDVVLVDGDRIGWAASGRNGGFCAASLTHGESNGRARFPDEYETLARLGQQNLDEIEATVAKYGIACDFRRTGELSVATEEYQVEELRHASGDFLDINAVRAEVASPTYRAGSWNRNSTALVDPAELCWGLADACAAAGVRIAEHTQITSVTETVGSLRLTTDSGVVLQTEQLALATNAFPSLLRRLRLFTVPVYDYVLMTEPLSAGQLASIGWQHRQGIGDSGNRFHYYRLTADNRILWGGYDALYYFGRRIRPAYDQRPTTFRLLAEHFFTTFPQLDGLRFSHRWGGAIDTCTRFFAFYGTAFAGRAAYALGHTGLGVGASRFAGNVMLDLLDGEPTERTSLRMVRSKPLPFPPEPLAYLGITATRHAMAAADRHGGRRNVWLRGLDAAGLGFDS